MGNFCKRRAHLEASDVALTPSPQTNSTSNNGSHPQNVICNGSCGSKIRLEKVIELPLRYELTVRPVIEELRVHSQLLITFKVAAAVQTLKKINMHADQLQFERVVIEKEGEDGGKEGEFVENKEFVGQTVSLQFKHKAGMFESGATYRIKVEYSSKITTDSNTRLYLSLASQFKDKEFKDTSLPAICQSLGNSPKRQEALSNIQMSTQFAPNYARSFFPCFDEPSFKAIFKLKVICQYEGMRVLSNCETEEIEERKDSTVFSFKETPVMSSYLLALVIGHFDCISQTCKNVPVTVRCWASLGESEQTRDQLEIAADTVDFCSEYFGIPYELEKLDLVSLNQHNFGAMENWGLITVKKGCLELPRSTASPSKFTAEAMTVVHEVSHMWYGNLVTCEWWDCIWLNEGFGKFYEHFILRQIRPELPAVPDFISQVYTPSLTNYLLPQNAHPIQNTNVFSTDLLFIYGNVTYKKGSLVVWMLKELIDDEELLRNCLRTYLVRFQYGNAINEDFLKVVDQVCQADYSSIILPWLQQLNFPVLQITRKSSDVYLLSQNNVVSTVLTTFPIPLNIISTNGVRKKMVFNGKQKEVRVEGVREEDFVHFCGNLSFLGLIQYQQKEESLGLLKKSDQFNEVDRFLLLYNHDKTFGSDASILPFFHTETSSLVRGHLQTLFGSYILKKHNFYTQWLETITYVSEYLKISLFQDLQILEDLLNTAQPNFNVLEYTVQSILVVALMAKDPQCCEAIVQIFTKLENNNFLHSITILPFGIKSILYFVACQHSEESSNIVLKKYLEMKDQSNSQNNIEIQYLKAALIFSNNMEAVEQITDPLIYFPLIANWQKKCLKILLITNLQEKLNELTPANQDKIVHLAEISFRYFYDGLKDERMDGCLQAFEHDIPDFKDIPKLCQADCVREKKQSNPELQTYLAHFVRAYS